MDIRHDLIAIFRRALKAVNGRIVVSESLKRDAAPPPGAIIALGKAASAMWAGARDVYGGLVDSLLVTKYGHHGDDAFDGAVRVIEAGHPELDAASLNAGRALLEFIDSRAATDELLFLISGGTSSLVEVLPPSLTLEELRRINAWLLGSGLDIRQMNAVRKQLSRIKGGRLAQALRRRRATVLLISDVPDDDPAVIGSGMLFADDSAIDLAGTLDLPGWIARHFADAPALPRSTDPCFTQVCHRLVASNQTARQAAADAARDLGYQVHEHEVMTGDVMNAADRIAAVLLQGPPGVHVWGGETTLRLPSAPGRGGRNQHLALAVAQRIIGRSEIGFLAGATDGSDGSTDHAGALVDGSSVRRGESRPLDAGRALERADSATFLDASGDTLRTGPTGTNVMDLLIGMRLSTH